MAIDWRERYSGKLATAQQAIKRIRTGDRVFIGSACGEPQALVRALVEGDVGLSDTELVQVLTLGVAPYADPKFAAMYRANAFFIGNNVRDAINESRADYTPIFLSQVPGLFRSGRVQIDVALIMVSPPDVHGYCSLGVSVDITKAAVEVAGTVIVQVNSQMPRALGDCFVHVDDVECLVDCDEPLLEWPVVGEPDDVVLQIAANVARLVSDGATLQLGIGKLPDTVLSLLSTRNDLGIHTEMFSDGVMRLAKAGVINGKRKTLHKGKIVGSFAAGSRDLFEFLNNNAAVEMHPSEYTNDPFVISRHDNMVAINSALEVDLTGQVCADSIGERFYSGIGGHADFMRGAALAPGGKPIISLPSTAKTKDGLVSRITPSLTPGAGVTTTRGDVHYVVTEYGIAYLHGKTMRERAMSLIGVAHPDFRAELLHAAKRRRIVYLDQILPPAQAPYPPEYESTLVVDGDKEVLLRPIRPDDESLIKEMYYSFSEHTVLLRFHSAMKAMPHRRLQMFCNIDYDTEMSLIATIGPEGDEEVIALGQYIADPGKATAEVAFVVRDDWQRKGLGTRLLDALIDIAQAKGVRGFEAYVMAENSAMLKVFHRSGLDVNTNVEGDVIRITMSLASRRTTTTRGQERVEPQSAARTE